MCSAVATSCYLLFVVVVLLVLDVGVLSAGEWVVMWKWPQALAPEAMMPAIATPTMRFLAAFTGPPPLRPSG